VGDPKVLADIAVIAPLAGESLLVFAELGAVYGGRCPSEDRVTLERGTPLYVHVVSKPKTLVVANAKGEGRECDLSFGDECVMGCSEETWTERDYIFDVASRKQTLMIEQDGRIQPDGGYLRRAAVVKKADTLYVRNGGCDRTFPLASPGGGKDGG